MITDRYDPVVAAYIPKFVAPKVKHLVHLAERSGDDGIMPRFELIAGDVLKMNGKGRTVEEHLKEVAEFISIDSALKHLVNILLSRAAVIGYRYAKLLRHTRKHRTRKVRHAGLVVSTYRKDGIAVENCIDVLRKKDSFRLVIHFIRPY